MEKMKKYRIVKYGRCLYGQKEIYDVVTLLNLPIRHLDIDEFEINIVVRERKNDK